MKYLLTCLILTAVAILPASAAGSEKDVKPFYDALFSGDYAAAIGLAESWTASDAGAALAADLFRIAEAARYTETVPAAKDALVRILAGKSTASSPALRDIAKTLLLSMHVRSGDSRSADALRKEMGLPASLRIMGPFSISGEDSLRELSSAVFAGLEGQTYEIRPDGEGVFRFHAICDDVRNKAFAAETFLDLSAESEVRFGIGGSGFLDIAVDGISVYAERRERIFSPLQKTLKLRLSKGGHRISTVVSSSGGNELSLRLSFGECTPSSSLSAVSGTLLSCKAEPPITDGEGSALEKGYCMTKLGFGSQATAGKFFDLISGAETYSKALSRYYLALFDDTAETKDRLLREAAAGGIGGASAALARLSFDKERFVAGSDLTDRFGEAYPHSPEFLELKALRSICAYWHEDAAAICDELSRAGYPSAGEFMAAKAFGRSGHGRDEYDSLKAAYQRDRSSLEIAGMIEDCAAGAPDASALEMIAADHPWNVNFLVSLAEKIHALKGGKNALPFVTAALRNSPYHSRALFLAGEIYRISGETRIAESYMSRAVENADREEFRRCYEIHFGKKKETVPDDIDSWNAVSDRWSKEPAVCVSNNTDTILYDDGSIVTSVREVYRVFSRNRAKSLEEKTVIVNRNTDELVALVYRSVSNGVVVQSDNIRTKDLSDPDSRIYIDMMEYSIRAPDVKPGGYLVFEYVLRSNSGRSFKGYYGDEKFYDPSMRTLDSRLTVTSSRDLFVKGYRCSPAIRRLKKDDGRIQTSVSIGPITPVKDEAGMLPFASRAPSIAVTTFSGWKEFNDWFSSQLVNRTGLPAPALKEIDALCKGSSGAEDTVGRIYRCVTERIRYVGDEAGLGGYIPRPAGETWENRAGDCKDIALLLSVLLREKGIPADIALLRTADSGNADMSFPALSSFNHAVCRVSLAKPLYLDGTVRKSGIMDLPLPDRDVDALVIGKEKPFVERIDGALYSVPEENAETTVTIRPDLNAVCTRSVIRGGVLSVADDDSTDGRYLSRYWTKLYPGAEIGGLTRTGGNGLPLLTKYSISLPGFAQKTDGELFVPAVIVPYSLYDSFGRSVSRENDLYVGDYRESVTKVLFRLPEGFEVKHIPENTDISFGGIRLRYAFSSDSKNSCTVTARLSVRRCVLKKEEYAAIRKFLSRSALVEGSYICASAGGGK